MNDEAVPTGAPKPTRVGAPPTYRFPKTDEGLLPWSHAEPRLERSRYHWLADGTRWRFPVNLHAT